MDSLTHWGILGMKWGVRRYQNPDGTYAEAGKKRRAKKILKFAAPIAASVAGTYYVTHKDEIDRKVIDKVRSIKANINSIKGRAKYRRTFKVVRP